MKNFAQTLKRSECTIALLVVFYLVINYTYLAFYCILKGSKILLNTLNKFLSEKAVSK